MSGPFFVAATLASAALSAAGTIQEGRAEAAAASFNAAMARQQAAREREIAAQEAANFRRRAGRRLATARTLRSGSGVTVEGTPLMVREARAADSELGARRIEASGASAAVREEQRAMLHGMRGRSALRASVFRAGSTLLTGASRIDFGGSPPTSPPIPTVPHWHTGPGGRLAGPV